MIDVIAFNGETMNEAQNAVVVKTLNVQLPEALFYELLAQKARLKAANWVDFFEKVIAILKQKSEPPALEPV